GITSQVMENPVTPLSSTQVRRVLAEGGGEGLVPTQVLDYIRQQGLYGCGYSLAQLRETAKSLMNPQRYHHSVCVERQAVHLAQLYGGDKNKAAAAAILHDICKNMTNDHLLQMLALSATIVNIDFSAQPQLLHSYAGAVYIRDRLGITDDDIINAVRYHTTARAGMSLLERIVYLADLTSEERNDPDVAVMRSLADSSQNEAMLYALEYIVQDLEKRGLAVCEYTRAALAEYRKKQS
ncbi:MAG: bis(5'-nucleosyl)-tetraphosphatase (symmetrical) YqeK, partial [Angelakisella sp.]